MNFSSKRPEGMSGSFLPEEYLVKKAETRSVFISVALFTVVTMGVVGAFFVTNRQWNSVKTLQEDINREYATETQKIEQLKVLEAQKAEMLEKAEITTGLIEKVPRSILLAELINRMPQQMTLTELNLKSKRIVDAPKPKDDPAKPKPRSLAGPATMAAIKAAEAAKAAAEPVKRVATRFEFKLEMLGLAGNDAEIADYHKSLTECPLLDKVEMLYSGEVKVEDVPMRKFRIEAIVRTNADARQMEPLHVPRLPSRPDLTTRKPIDPMDPTVPREVTDALRAEHKE